MNFTVLLSSGDEDEWDDVLLRMSMDLGGALMVYREVDHVITPEEVEELTDGFGHMITKVKSYGAGEVVKVEDVLAIYAPGMWMKFEKVEDDQS